MPALHAPAACLSSHCSPEQDVIRAWADAGLHVALLVHQRGQALKHVHPPALRRTQQEAQDHRSETADALHSGHRAKWYG